MAVEKRDILAELEAYRAEYGFKQKIPLSKKENKACAKLARNNQELPQGVHRYPYEYTEEYYTLYEPEMTQQQVMEYLTFKKLAYLRTIKSCAVFFTTITVIGMIVVFFAILFNLL